MCSGVENCWSSGVKYLRQCIAVFLCLFSMNATSGPVFFSEIHYDNAGGDVGEGFEITGDAGMNLDGWKVSLINGSNGRAYSEIILSGVIDNEINDIGALAFIFGPLQNSVEGLALFNAFDELIQFISYEGVITNELGMSQDIGESERSNSPVGTSLQLFGVGIGYDDFSWATGIVSSFGNLNPNLVFEASGPEVTVSEPFSFSLMLFSVFGLIAMKKRTGGLQARGGISI